MRRRRADGDNPGGDSFLDIVANLIGILVILVMVIGVRAQDAWVESKATSPKENPDIAAMSRTAKSVKEHSRDLTRNVNEIEQQALELQELSAQRHSERHQLNVLLTHAQRNLDGFRQQIDQQGKDKLALLSKVRTVSAELEQIESQRQLLENSEAPVIELEHLPTPMAKTVFGREKHFRLKDQRLVYVPLEELTEKLRAEAPTKVWKLKQTNQITELIGPVQDFHLRYTLVKNNYARVTKVGPMVRQIAELKRFDLLPTTENIGEPLSDALQTGSQFQLMLESFDPENTVITVWTYPDSFAEFRQLKRRLFALGFATAARPLPEGHPISGSPSGTRSAAQ